jgi:hypothetical protein
MLIYGDHRQIQAQKRHPHHQGQAAVERGTRVFAQIN